VKDTDNTMGRGGGGDEEEDEEEEIRRKGWKMRGRRRKKTLCLMFHWISDEVSMTGHLTDCCVTYRVIKSLCAPDDYSTKKHTKTF
jgi:hypothetical protein